MEKIISDFNPKITSPVYLVRKRLLQGISVNAVKLNGKLLDFGCGSKPYKTLFTNIQTYTGIDFENPGHSHANEQIDVFYDGKKIPFDNNIFDSVFSSEVFEHVFNLPQILPEINRVMKIGGLILVTCPFAICEHEQPNDFARYSSFALKHLFTTNGFEVIEFEKLGNSIEVLCQLWIMYLYQNRTFLKKIPVLRSILRFLSYTLLNVMAICFGKILPKGEELYLNNLILCRKINDI